MMSRRVSWFFLIAFGITAVFLPIRLARAQGSSDARTFPSNPLADTQSGPGFGSGQIRGTVRTFDGHTVSQAGIEARNMERGTVLASVRSDSNGSFTLTNLPAGKYEILASVGAEQTSERVQVNAVGETTVDFCLPHKESASSSTASGATVSFAQYRVPAKARSLYEKAAQLMARGKVDQALEKANAALSVFPRFSEALTLRGIIKEMANKTEEALKDYQLAIQCDASFPLAYLAMASALNSLGRFTDALPALGQFDRIAPNRWETSYEFARASIGKYDFEGALRNIDRASQLHGGPQNDSAEIHLVRGYALLGLSNLPKASGEIHAFLARQPSGRTSDAAREVLSKIQSTTTTTASR